jgi:cysteine sulfinate desulfinase/cysteine desulfurase-like protein
MGNYHPILTQIGTQTKNDMLSSNFIKPEVLAKFQDGRRRHFGNSSACHTMGNYHPILMQIVTQTMNEMLSLKITIPEV